MHGQDPDREDGGVGFWTTGPPDAAIACPDPRDGGHRGHPAVILRVILERVHLGVYRMHSCPARDGRLARSDALRCLPDALGCTLADRGSSPPSDTTSSQVRAL